MTPTPFDLDVRPILRSGGEPFSAIMEAVASLAPGQGLRLVASFKPVSLFQVLGAQGFEPSAREIGNGDWEVLFTPVGAAPAEDVRDEATAEDIRDDWHAASVEIDCRDLPPPEPMVKVLEAAEALNRDEALAALLPREPRFLFPELEARGFTWRGEALADGSYRISIRRDGGRSGHD